MKAFADDKLNIVKMTISFFDRVEKSRPGKGDNAGYQHFLLFPQCFPKPSSLIHYHTMPNFDALKIYSCGKHCEKRRNCLSQAISPSLTMFSTVYGTLNVLL